jgi:AraC family transcriptional regulator
MEASLDTETEISLISANETFVVENHLAFSGGVVEVRQYNWVRPTQDIWTGERYLLDMPLFRRPGISRAAYLDTNARVGRDLRRIMFVPPGRLVRSGSGEGRHRAMLCLIDRELIEGLLDEPPDWNEVRLADGLSLNCPEIDWLLQKVYREVRESGFAAKLMVDRLAGVLAILLIRRFGLDAQVRHVGGLTPRRMKIIQERLHSDQRPPSSAELAKLCAMSVRHLSRSIKTETGLSISKLIEQAVMERARMLLTERHMGVAEVAQRIGFSSASTFCQAFRRATGMRPSQVPRMRV